MMSFVFPDANPTNKEVQLLANLDAKIKAEGVDARKMHEEFNAPADTTPRLIESA